jgi:DNA invertase Pin-like site-specific DNA recombinase
VETKLFDILLVFTFDRLGRIENETPVIVEWLSSQGIEIWSVTEGEQKLNGTADKLSNYLRYWQSSEESHKIALRVNEKHKQMVKDGIFRGGNPPYGYRLKKNGETNKNSKELFDLEIHPEESKIIKKIYELVFHDNYGGNRIVKFLNKNSIPTKTGGKWGCSVVNYILRNPIYKGYMVYNKTIRKLTGHTTKTIQKIG